MDVVLHAARPLLAAAFTLWGSPVTWLEVAAFVLALAMVVLNMRVHPLAWPLAIASSLMYWLLFWDSKLYAEASLQIFFALVALWGWWQWLRGTDAQGRPLVVRALPARSWWALGGFVLLTWPALGAALDRFTDSDVPYWDAFPTTLSLTGQWLLGRKYIDNWPTWIVVNVASVALFAYKQLWLTALLYALFVLLSVAGWRAWRTLAATQPQTAS
jgi:nicotinamide mononucleotide transporter